MTPLRAPFARLLTSCSVLALVAVLITACGLRSRTLEPGTYRAVIELAGSELPFGLDVAREEAGVVLYLVNGQQRVRVTDVTVTDGQLAATMPDVGNTLTVEVRGDTLKGEVSLLGAGGKRQVLPFRAESGQAWRFFEDATSDNADVSGRWALTFTDDSGQQSPGVAEFSQSFERVTGTVQTSAGELPCLAGEVRGDELFLSCFDGRSAALYKARVDDDGLLVGEYWSTSTAHQAFRAARDADAVLDTAPDAADVAADGRASAVP